MFSRPKILFLVSLLFVALLNPKFNPYLPFKGVVCKYRSSLSATVVGILGRLWFTSGYVTLRNIIVIRKST